MRGFRPTDLESAIARTSLAFLEDRLEERVTLEWALTLDASHEGERRAIRELFEHSHVSVAEPYLSAWRRLFHYWDRPDPSSSYDRLLLKRELKQMSSPREIAALIVDAVRPWLKVTVRGRLEALYGLPIPKKPKHVRDLLSVTFSSGDPLTPDELGLASIDDADLLEELARKLDAALFSALALAREIGAVTDRSDETLWQLHRSYFVPPAQWEEGGNEPDRFGHGFANCVKLLHAVIERIGAVKPDAARRLISALPRDEWNLYRRLWAGLARDASLVSAREVEAFLTGLPDMPFWMLGQFPEVAELRAVRWSSLSDPVRKKLERRIRRGTPARLRPRRLSADEGKEYSQRRASVELQRIQVAGGELSNAAIQFLAEVATTADMPKLASVTDGFAAGVRIYSTSPGQAGGYQDLSNEQLLKILSAETDDDDGNIASFVGRNPSLAVKLLDQTEKNGASVGKIWRALGYHHRPPDLNATIATANAETVEAAEAAKDVLTLIANLEEQVVENEIDALSSWMNAWDRLLNSGDDFLSAWFRLWPAAVTKVNRSSDRERPLRERAHGSPVGDLTSAVFSALPQLSETSENPFGQSPLSDVLQVLGDCEGEAKLEVRYRAIASMAYFYLADPEWTRTNLVEPIRDASGDEVELWGAFANARLPQAEVMTLLGSALAAAAANGEVLTPEDRGHLARQVIWSHILPRLPRPYSAAVNLDLTQQMLRMGDDAVRVGAVRALKDLLVEHQKFGLDVVAAFDLVKSIFEQVWPRERTLNSPRVSEALVELPAESRTNFAAAAEMIMPYLVPFDCWSLYDYGIWRTSDQGKAIQGINTPAEAESLLAMFGKTVGDHEGAIIPNGLDLALEHIVSKAPRLEADPRYQRLLTLSRR